VFLGSLRNRIVSFANRDNLTSSFPILIPFISCSCLVALARNSRITLNRSGESGQPYLIPDFKGNGFRFSMVLALGLSYVAFYCVE
jgi:hypothetical protein